MKKTFEKFKYYVPKASFVGYAVFLIGLVIIISARISPAFAEFWTVNIASVFRSALSYATYIFPCSVAEFIVLSLPILFVALIVYAMKCADSWEKSIRCIVALFSAAALIYGMVNINFATGYHTPSLYQRLDLQKNEIDAEDLYNTAKILLDESNKLSKKIFYGSDKNSYMVMSYDELSKKLNLSYDGLSEKYTFLPKMNTRIKPIVASRALTYMHISGIYTFFTGESNVNTDFPDYTQPYVCAHEMAHQRGIAREDEANFIAFLACESSDDEYIRYSGYLELYSYVASALYQTDDDMYFKLLETMENDVRGELIAYNNFFEKYEDNTAADISEIINDTHLKNNGQSAGTKSYNLVTELAVAYFNK